MAEDLAATDEIVSGIGSWRMNNSSQHSCIFCMSFQNMNENILTFQKYGFYEAMAFVKVY